MNIMYELNNRQKEELWMNIYDTLEDKQNNPLSQFKKQNITLHINTKDKKAKWEFFMSGRDFGTIKDNYNGCLRLLEKYTKIIIEE